MSQTQQSTPTGGDDSPLETRIVRRRLDELKPREINGAPKNARFMKPATFKRLVANLQRDKVLTQLPLVYRDWILSGHHRVRAALDAGIVEHDVQELVGEYSEERLTAIQLAHNAITGEDDPNTLAEMYGSLPLAEQLYSGLSDEIVAPLEELDLASLSAGPVQYQELVLTFLPEHADEFLKFLNELKTTKRSIHLCSAEEFDRLFDTLVKTKNVCNVFNTALAMRALVQLAAERLEQLENGTPA